MRRSIRTPTAIDPEKRDYPRGMYGPGGGRITTTGPVVVGGDVGVGVGDGVTTTGFGGGYVTWVMYNLLKTATVGVSRVSRTSTLSFHFDMG